MFFLLPIIYLAMQLGFVLIAQVLWFLLNYT